jgi:hypothetical protein
MIYELRFWRALFFNENAMIGIRTCATVSRAWIYFVIAVLLQVLPVNKQDIAMLYIDVPKIAILYFGLVLLGAVVSWLLRAKMPFYKFLYTSSTIMTFGGVVMAVITYASILLEMATNAAWLTNVIISIIPFYYIVLFAYSIDVASHLSSQWKRVLVGVLMVCAMFFAYFYL